MRFSRNTPRKGRERVTLLAWFALLLGTLVLGTAVTATGPSGMAVNAKPTPTPPGPSIAIETYLSTDGGQSWLDADAAPGPFIPAGTAIQWLYAVTNTGTTTLTKVTISDDRGVAITPPRTVLQVGESMNATGNSTAVAGPYASNGTVAGTAPGGSAIVTATDPCHYIGVAPPAASFGANVTSGTAPLAVRFTDASIGEGITAWAWDFGDGVTSAVQSPVHTYTAAGTFTVNLTVTNPSGSASDVKAGYITVGEPVPPPTATFIANATEGTAPMTVQFTDTSSGTIDAWLWDFGDGDTSTEQDPAHTFASDGVYTVTLTVTGAGGADSHELEITVRPVQPVTADFEANATSGVAPLAVEFTDLSTSADSIISWQWDLDGDGSIDSVEQNPVHMYTAAGTYSVTLTAGTAHRSDAATKTGYIVVTAAPSVLAVPPSTLLPTDGGGDGLYEDVNGNGRLDFADAVLYFNQMAWISAHEPVSAFDFNGNGRIDFADVVWLFNHL